MSCTLCRLPFTPHKTSVDPYPPPPGLLTDRQYRYFINGVAIGQYLPTVLLKVEWLDQGFFGGYTGAVMVLKWESDGGTVMVFHTVCASILRRIFKCEDESNESIIKLCEIEFILGRPLQGLDGGRLPRVGYEDVGDEKLDLRPYYYLEEHGDLMRFDYEMFKDDGHSWALNKPDAFPRFRNMVAPTRFPGPPPEETTDILTKQPLDILHVLLPYLPNPSFVRLLSTCRTFRHAALTTFQAHARQRVLELGWAVPLSGEYASASQSIREQDIMVDPDAPPFDGDWLFYLSSIHKSQSLRARRRLWALGEEILRTVEEHRIASGYDEAISTEDTPQSRTRKQLERHVGDPLATTLRKLGSLKVGGRS